MIASREVFWNIEFGQIVYALGACSTAIFVYAIYRRARLWRINSPVWGWPALTKSARLFISTTMIEIVLHKRMLGLPRRHLNPRGSIYSRLHPIEAYSGIAHLLVVAGFGVLFLASFVDFLSHNFFHFLSGGPYLAFSLMADCFGLLAIVGVAMLGVKRYVLKSSRLDNRLDDLTALLLLAWLLISGFLLEGFRIAATELKHNLDWAIWSPGGYVLALAFAGLDQDTLLVLHRVTWWLHALSALAAIAYVFLSWSKLTHIVVSPLGVLFRSHSPHGVISLLPLKRGDAFGVSKVQDFAWQQLLDLDACTRCGRCQDVCPSYISGKPLNPKKLIQDIKMEFEVGVSRVFKGAVPIHERDLLNQTVGREEIWSCTLCRACDDVCPLYVQHVDKIVDMRRALVLDRSDFPPEAKVIFRNMENHGNPWGKVWTSRAEWADRMRIPVLEEGDVVDLLLWVGCVGSFDDRNRPVTRSLVRVLQEGGMNFGIMGKEERCCGDPARRLGEEYLFQTMAKRNIDLLNKHGVKFIVTACPHCFNVIKNEYPQLGGNFTVMHHSELIAQLLRDGKIKLSRSAGAVTYHDSCYLGRYNDVIDAPRDVLRAAGQNQPLEMQRSKDNSFCCGGGGGHMWLAERSGRKINVMRAEQALATAASTIATACPHCLVMLEDGISQKGLSAAVKVVDIAELTEEALV